MEMVGLTVWEMNLGFRPKDFKSVWGALIQKNSPKKTGDGVEGSSHKCEKRRYCIFRAVPSFML